jgi:hypothetical protein
LIDDEEQPWLDLEETDAMNPLRAASIRDRVALGYCQDSCLHPRCLNQQLGRMETNHNLVPIEYRRVEGRSFIDLRRAPQPPASPLR